MRRSLTFLVLAGLMVCGLGSSAPAAGDEDLAEAKVELKKGDRIIFFGDSLTELAGREEPKQHVTKGYVKIVREKLTAAHQDKDLEIEWVATGGHTVPDLNPDNQPSGILTYDGNHFNQKGHDFVAEQMLKMFK